MAVESGDATLYGIKISLDCNIEFEDFCPKVKDKSPSGLPLATSPWMKMKPLLWLQALGRLNSTSRKSKMPEEVALCQTWSALIENFNKAAKAYRTRIVAVRQCFESFYTFARAK
ncbi:hypothetical protein PPTG_21919 [Phytophthora nicotianae INRA-310]|uniref:Uncharacterized protein n=1 Tax=Phytophthora nicotianae (strain INRA-310) TaxID=761204 RepID=W2QQT0_PHYN3|nr:hypothetical protein PPTG_21919 [Phytophthora nicotianae INRA-310]ETN15286.1 hypothetical protein PPTG_21919 [Phytophthora nicotianae INRA-310]